MTYVTKIKMMYLLSNHNLLHLYQKYIKVCSSHHNHSNFRTATVNIINIRANYQLEKYVMIEVKDYGNNTKEIVLSQKLYNNHLLTKKDYILPLQR